MGTMPSGSRARLRTTPSDDGREGVNYPDDISVRRFTGFLAGGNPQPGGSATRAQCGACLSTRKGSTKRLGLDAIRGGRFGRPAADDPLPDVVGSLALGLVVGAAQDLGHQTERYELHPNQDQDHAEEQ